MYVSIYLTMYSYAVVIVAGNVASRAKTRAPTFRSCCIFANKGLTYLRSTYAYSYIHICACVLVSLCFCKSYSSTCTYIHTDILYILNSKSFVEYKKLSLLLHRNEES